MYLPAVRRIAAVLREHAAAIEWPSVAWLKETYPARASDGADTYAQVWLAYTRSWETVTPRSLGRRWVRRRQ